MKKKASASGGRFFCGKMAPFMSNKGKFSILSAFAILILVIYAQVGDWQSPKDYFGTATVADQRIIELLASTSKTYAIDERVKFSNCIIDGSYPDHACSPGAIFPDAGTSTICVSGYTKKVRSVSASLKKKVYAEYGIAYPQPTGSYEADHLIPLELGGSNDIANLFPEAKDPNPGFKEKDLVENYLHNEVCAGNLDLRAAQKQIANDWLAVYNTLSSDKISELKSQYTSWAK